MRVSARLNMLLKKSKSLVARGLKSARDSKKRELFGTTKVVP